MPEECGMPAVESLDNLITGGYYFADVLLVIRVNQPVRPVTAPYWKIEE